MYTLLWGEREACCAERVPFSLGKREACCAEGYFSLGKREACCAECSSFSLRFVGNEARTIGHLHGHPEVPYPFHCWSTVPPLGERRGGGRDTLPYP